MDLIGRDIQLYVYIKKNTSTGFHPGNVSLNSRPGRLSRVEKPQALGLNVSPEMNDVSSRSSDFLEKKQIWVALQKYGKTPKSSICS